MKKKLVILSLFVSLCLWAQVPQTIDYQGRLADNDGNYLNGIYSIEFDLFDMETGGTELWIEDQDVNVTNGIFHVLLGSVNPFPATLFDNTNLWLELHVGTEVLLPRTRIASVPYSIKADDAYMLNGLNSSDFMPATTDDWVDTTGDTMTGQLIVEDYVGIGTPTPGRPLTVNSTGPNPIQWQVNSEIIGQLGTNGSGAGGLYLYDNGPIAVQVTASGDSYLNGGNVGIGTDTPTSKLEVAGTIESTTGGIKFPDGTTQTTASVGDITSVTAGTGLNGGGTSGNVTVNVDVPLNLSGNVGSSDGVITGINTGNGAGINGTGNYGGYFQGDYRGADCVVFPSEDNSYIGVRGFVIGGFGTNYAFFGAAAGSGTNYAGYFNGNLAYTGTLSGPSDERLKENIQPFRNALSKVKLMDVHTYNYKQIEEKQLILPEGDQIGLIAQELEEILPELVTDEVLSYDKNEGIEGAERDLEKFEYKGINYIGLIPVLIEAIKELNTQNTEQEKLIKAQQIQNAEQQNQIEQLLRLIDN